MSEPRAAWLCRALGTHALKPVGAIIVLPNNARRVSLQCERCGTWRHDVWNRRTGALEGGRSYERTEDYKTYVGSHTRDAARLDIMGDSKESKDEGKHPGLRLLQGRETGGRKRTARHRRATS